MRIGDLEKPLLPAASESDALLASAKRAAERGDAGETARQFEQLFGVMLVRELRRSMPDGLFGSGAGADVYEGWFDEQLGGALAGRDALGIAGMVKTSLGRAQAARDATEAVAAVEGANPAAKTVTSPLAPPAANTEQNTTTHTTKAALDAARLGAAPPALPIPHVRPIQVRKTP